MTAAELLSFLAGEKGKMLEGVETKKTGPDENLPRPQLGAATRLTVPTNCTKMTILPLTRLVMGVVDRTVFSPCDV